MSCANYEEWEYFDFGSSSIHKIRGVLDPLIELGVNIVFLPVYSPDLVVS
ncbi:MAG: hypothetical protein LBE70_04155 [Nitrososphaerota archaeon]|nr:hypothetical protein [Nitrososphaerota archaeon]